ncbi:MAG: VWA domain-containing protein [Candidatus Omnitrophota bacterium]
MKKSKLIVISVTFSLAAHAILLASSPFIAFPGMREVRDETRKIFRLREVREKPIDVDFFGPAKEPPPSIKLTRHLSEQEKKLIQKMRLEERLAEDMPIEEKKKKLQEELPERELQKAEKFDPLEFLEKEAERLKKEAAPEKRSLADRLLSEGPSVVPPEEVSEEALQYGVERVDYGRLTAAPGIGEAAKEEFFRPGKKELAALEGEAQLGAYEDIDRFIKVDLFTYTAQRTGEKYFKLVIGVKEGDRLPVIPKEIIFMIDSSKSITEEKLSYIKEAVKNVLWELNPYDRFNVVAFGGDVVRFKERSVEANELDVYAAGVFLKDLVAVGQTDVNSALLDIVSNHVTFYPSYVMLISDGRPTKGVLDSRRIIQQITRRNNMERPIFCFGGGARVNRYLLDFISYQNRAWSQFTPTAYEITDAFGDFCRQVKDPLLVNVRYRFGKLDTQEIYPKFLSDFYRGRPFVLYGRYNKEDVFSMQLLGQIRGETKEFIYTGSLKKAEEGDENIAKEWAFTKIYHLISQLAMGMGDPISLRREINNLSKKYGIITPYDLRDGD